MTLRGIIVAVVSSERQAADDLSSLPLQLERTRQEFKRQGITEEHEPICIYQSRDFYDLAELRAESPEYDRLCTLAGDGKIDVVGGRDHSRVLGRTEALQVQLRTFLQLAQVQLLFYASPSQVVPRSELGRRGRAHIANNFLHAVAAVRDEEEVARLVQRREDGMNRHAQAGRWKASGVPFGYRREVLGADPATGRVLYGTIIIEPSEAAHIRRIAREYAAGASMLDAQKLSDELLGREQEILNWDRIETWATNPTYVGIMLYGRVRADVTIGANGKPRKVKRIIVTSARAADLAEAFLLGRDDRTPEEIAAGVILAWGEWEPVFKTESDIDLWRRVQAERRARRKAPAACATTPGRAHHLFSSIAVCGYCGGPVSIVNYKYKGSTAAKRAANDYIKTAYYGCSSHRRSRKAKVEPRACVPNLIRAEHLAEQFFSDLAELTEDVDALAGLLAESKPAPQQGDSADAEARLTKARASLARWDAAYEAGAIDAIELRDKRAPLIATIRQLEAELVAGKKESAPAADPYQQAEALRHLSDTWQDYEPRYLKALLRQHVAAIVIRDKRVVEVEFK